MYGRYDGYKFEEALERWTDPEEFETVRAEIMLLKFYHDRSAAADRLAARTRMLQDELFRRLRQGEILSSSITLSSTSRGLRTILPAEAYSLPGICYDWRWNALRADGYTFNLVEFFLPSEVPSNVRELHEILGGIFAGQPEAAVARPVTGTVLAKFKADSTYEHVCINGREFALTKLQASVVEVLHKASQSPDPWVHVTDLREQIGFGTEKLSSLFRRLDDWRLIICSDRRGHYRLNLKG